MSQPSKIDQNLLKGSVKTHLIGRYAKQTVRDLGNAYKSVIDDE